MPTNVESMTQKLLPVMAHDKKRLLGTVALETEVIFEGDEEIVSINGNPYPIQHVSMIRMSDLAPIHFMAIVMDSHQERVGMQNHLPKFGSVTTNTPLQVWLAPRHISRAPSYDSNSAWSAFLQTRPKQDSSVLSVEKVIQIP